MSKRLIGLGSDGKLNLRLPSGQSMALTSKTEANAFVLLDCSGSMFGPKLVQAKRGAIDYSDEAISKGYAVGVISFQNFSRLVCQPKRDISEIESCLKRIDADGGTNLTPAIKIATEQLSSLGGMRVIFIATDGQTKDPDLAIAEAEKAKSLGIKIMTIRTEDADQYVLDKIASSGDWSLSVESEDLRRGIADAAGLLPAATDNYLMGPMKP